MDNRTIELSVISSAEAEARFKELDPSLPRRGLTLSAYFNNSFVVFIDGDVSPEAITLMERAEYTHVSFSNYPGADNWIDTFELLISEYFCNSMIIETIEELRIALVANKW